jgi:K+-sensing histidine kinase KdpD
LDECVRETRATFREIIRNLRTVLEFERFEAGDVSLKEERVLLSDVIEAAAGGLGHLASTLHKTIVVDNAAYSSPIHGDDKCLLEAVSDLATYVLRETDNHTCYLRASSERGIACLRVYGDQHHIAVAARSGIFDPFSGHHLKEKPARAAHKVGLALAKIIVEAHRGSISIADIPGAGSAFLVEFPTHWPVEEPASSE